MRIRWIIGIAALQVMVLAYMAGEREWVLRTGRTIWLRSAPIDPRDAMRGDYVRVNYELSRVPRTLCKGRLASTKQGFEDVPRDTKAYALLSTNEDGIAELVNLSSDLPAAGLFMRGRTDRSWGDYLQVRYGIEAYFMEQGKAEQLEQATGRQAVRVPLEMQVALSPGGLAVLKGYRKGPLGIGLEVETKQISTNGQRRARTVGATVRLLNASTNDLAIVDLPQGRSLALVPDAQWAANRWRWAHEADSQPAPESAQIIILKPGESHSIRVAFDDPYWTAIEDAPGGGGSMSPVKIPDITQDWSARFRLEYRPPARTACAKLPNAGLIWHGRLASRAFNPAGSAD
jgi:uncharacterized membrane-anchored protein